MNTENIIATLHKIKLAVKEKTGKGATFILRLKDDYKNGFNKQRLYHVTSDTVSCALRLALLTNLTDGKAIVEVWEDNGTEPVAFLGAGTVQTCESCEDRFECESRGEVGGARLCKKTDYFSIYMNPEEQEKKESPQTPRTPQTPKDNKPSGLNADTSISDILLEMNDIFNKK